VTEAAPTVTVTETATEPATTEEAPATEEAPTTEEAPAEEPLGNPCDYVSAADIEKAVGESFEDGVASQPDGVEACLWMAPDGDAFVGILVFESARDFPGGWQRLNKETWTDADYEPLWDLLGVDAPVQGAPGWASYGCARSLPGSRAEAFAIMLVVLDHDLTMPEVQKVWDLLDEVETACVADSL
jgi:hypothetical protein